MMTQSKACLNMIKQQLRTNNINDEAILELFTNYPREKFIPENYQAFAYVDMHIPLDNGEVLLTPLEEARILQSGQFKPEDHVLVMGSSHSYLIALLSFLCAKVIVIDIDAQKVVETKQHLKKQQIKNVELMVRDNYNMKLSEEAVDAIICPASIQKVPNVWFESLKSNGRLFVSLGDEVQHAQWLHLSHQKVVGHEFVFSTHLPLLPLMQAESKFIF